MAVPVKKTSKSRTRRRHAAWQRVATNKLSQQTTLTRCTHCGSIKRAHHVCDACGYYRGKQVKTVKASKESVLDA